MDHLPGVTVNRYCSSSLQTTRMAFHAIKAGEGDAFISAGVETVSRFVNGCADDLPEDQNPVFADAQARTDKLAGGGRDLGRPARRRASCPTSTSPWARPPRTSRSSLGMSRQEQDEFARPQPEPRRAAIEEGFWAREITPVTLPDGTVVSADDGPRAGTTLEGVSQLKPVFRPDGTVTAGNCCPLNDGAAALVIMSDTKAKELGLTPLARIVVHRRHRPVAGDHGPRPGRGDPGRRWRNAGMTIDDIDLFEINEAFAVQALGSAQQLGIPTWTSSTCNGGAIAVGHPFGMTGARITSTLINSLQWHDKQFGVETMCVGGGMGMAMVLERLSVRPIRTGRPRSSPGASRGIGLGIAERLVGEGARVVITARNKEALDEAVAHLGGPDAALAVAGKADDTDHQDDAVRQAIDGVRQRRLPGQQHRHQPDLRAAGRPRPRRGPQDRRGQLPRRVVLGAEGPRAWMKEHGGAVVNVSSVAGVRPAPGIGLYGATKAMLNSHHRAARRRARPGHPRQRGRAGRGEDQVRHCPVRRARGRGRRGATRSSGSASRRTSAAWSRSCCPRTRAG